jgi:hypothetical protein
MSSKSDLDNRSNQLNPNNPAYASSRGGTSHDDDGCHEVSPLTKSLYATPSTPTWVSEERDYVLGFVGVCGQVRLVQFSLKTTSSNCRYFGRRPDAMQTEYLEHFCENVRRMFRMRWSGLSFQMAFDGRGECIDWMTRHLSLHGRLERCDIIDPVCPAGLLVAPGEIVEARELLSRAAKSSIERWGGFEMPSKISSLSFEHEKRCQALVRGTKTPV